MVLQAEGKKPEQCSSEQSLMVEQQEGGALRALKALLLLIDQARKTQQPLEVGLKAEVDSGAVEVVLAGIGLDGIEEGGLGWQGSG